uniref:Uncharacterized protein n=1 Tax=Steinernema glaseri TaxID=37863 RepID=A0A1I8A893_9BILA
MSCCSRYLEHLVDEEHSNLSKLTDRTRFSDQCLTLSGFRSFRSHASPLHLLDTPSRKSGPASMTHRLLRSAFLVYTRCRRAFITAAAPQERSRESERASVASRRGGGGDCNRESCDPKMRTIVCSPEDAC